MARTSNVFARVEPEVKEQAEAILNQLGIPMSNAISIFLKQIVMQRGLPFEVRIPEAIPLAMRDISKEEFDAEIEKGFSDYKEGRYQTAANVFSDIEKEYDI